MTVVVALVGKDAIVLASDSQETAGTIKSTTQKLRIVGGKMAWGGAGDSALIQRVAANQDTIVPSLGGTEWEVALAISNAATPVQTEGVSSHLAVGGNLQLPTFGGIFCWYDANGQPRVWQVSPNVASSLFKGLRAAIGSGQAFAEVALASVAHLRVHELDLQQLQMVAWKSVFDVITTSSYGVGFPIRVAVIQPDSARLLQPEEVNAVRDSVLAWMERQRDVLGALAAMPSPDHDVAEVPGPPGEDSNGEEAKEEDTGIEPPAP
jgi:20S proteasome alpha/beta subunit